MIMLQSLWSFLQNNPQGLVPFPWKRCYDAWSDILYYKNTLDESIVVDFRSRINVGGGLYHRSNWWHFLTGGGGYSSNSIHDDEDDEPAACLITATCCGPLYYLVAPQMVHFCPLCHAAHTLPYQI